MARARVLRRSAALLRERKPLLAGLEALGQGALSSACFAIGRLSWAVS
jgi:hypothetical protein